MNSLFIKILFLFANLIIFDEELSPAQIKNYHKLAKDIKVIDRSALILDIFNWSGNIPLLNDLLHMLEIAMDISGAIIFKILVGMLFGPTLLLESND